jgi:hypothetical protein
VTTREEISAALFDALDCATSFPPVTPVSLRVFGRSPLWWHPPPYFCRLRPLLVSAPHFIAEYAFSLVTLWGAHNLLEMEGDSYT